MKKKYKKKTKKFFDFVRLDLNKKMRKKTQFLRSASGYYYL